MKRSFSETDPQKRKIIRKSFYAPPPPEDYSKNYIRLAVVCIIAVIFIAGEVVGGTIAHSVAIISDAIHLVSDLIGFIFSFIFLYLSKKRMDERVSFGYHRMELLGAIANLFIVWFLILLVVIEATSRIINKEFVKQPLIMLITAACGVVINIVLFKVLHGGATHSHGLMHDSCGHHHEHDHSHEHEHEHGYGHEHHHQHESHKHQHGHRAGEEHSHHHKQQSVKTGKLDIQDGLTKPLLHQGEKQENGSGKRIEQLPGFEIAAAEAEKESQSDPDSPTHVLRESIGMKAAVVHALSDLIQSVGVLISALIICFVGSNNGAEVEQWNAWHLFDPLATYLFSILSLVSTFPVVHNCYFLIMEATPEYIDLQELRKDFEGLYGVVDVHDIHVWDLKPGKTIMIAHVIAAKGMEREVLTQLTDMCRVKRIFHSTFQVEEVQAKDKDQYIACHHDIHH